MSALLESISEFESKESCRVVVLYDAADTREKALRFCNHLMLQFSEDLAFEFEWWRTDFLAEIQLAELSANQAENADVFIVCTSPDKQPSPPLKQWFGSWANKHAGHTGALVDLSAMPMGQSGCAWATQQFLREVSKAASLDYIEPVNDSSNAFGGPYQASQYTMTLLRDESPAPDHYGLNE